MKKIILFLLSLIITNSIYAQQFEKIWEFPAELICVGDIDADGICELANDDYNNKIITFYNISNQNAKWTINNARLFDEIYGQEKSNLQPDYLKFPLMDFNNDGNNEIFLKSGDGKGIILFDIVNNNNIWEWNDPQTYWIKFTALTDINGDNKLELIFLASYSEGYKTFIYSTNVQTVSSKNIQNEIPNRFKLYQNFPNPFNPSTTIEYEINNPENVKINIYDITGSLVRELVNEQKNTGKYTTIWNGRDNSGKIVVSGTYFYQIISGSFVQAKKMILLK